MNFIKRNLAVVIATASTLAVAQQDRPLRLVVPFPSGGPAIADRA